MTLDPVSTSSEAPDMGRHRFDENLRKARPTIQRIARGGVCVARRSDIAEGGGGGMMQVEFFLKCVQVVVRTMTVVALIAVAGCFDVGAITSGEIKTPFVTPVETVGQDTPERPIEEPIRPLDTPGALSIQEGDLNGDGTVDEFDIEVFGEQYIQYQDGEAFEATADFDGDSAITPSDLRLLLDLIASGAPPAADHPEFPR